MNKKYEYSTLNMRKILSFLIFITLFNPLLVFGFLDVEPGEEVTIWNGTDYTIEFDLSKDGQVWNSESIKPFSRKEYIASQFSISTQDGKSNITKKMPLTRGRTYEIIFDNSCRCYSLNEKSIK